MQRKEIIDAYLFLRKNNQSIPGDTLEFIKDASLVRFDSIFGNCKNCKHNGKKMIYPSGCTGCGAHDEFRNFTPVA